MAKHRVGDRRIISISIPEETARKLDRRVGKGKTRGRSATISKMIEDGLSSRNLIKRTSKSQPFRDLLGRIQMKIGSRLIPWEK